VGYADYALTLEILPEARRDQRATGG